jgi:FMN phosphatase YigB (HAD superfamily)
MINLYFIKYTMIYYIFDLDDTLIMHEGGVAKSYDSIEPDYRLNYLLGKCRGESHIYTNGTGGHALECIERMDIKRNFTKVYSRDTIPFMKPDFRSFKAVHNDIYRNPNDKFFFFDDQLVNLKIARSIGWFTFWIHPDYKQAVNYPFVTMAFPNIYECLTYLENKYQ